MTKSRSSMEYHLSSVGIDKGGLMFSFFILLFFGTQVMANSQVVAHIWSIDYPKPPEKETLLFLSTGLVLKTIQNKNIPFEIEAAIDDKREFVFNYTPERNLLSLRAAERKMTSYIQSGLNFSDFIPTTISSLSTARRYFREARYYEKESQCFNRAMVWSYEWWRRHSLKSNKILIFFTRNYIRRYNFEWWFHIAPLVNIFNEESVIERVMDVKYSSGPLSLKSWTDIFMKGNPDCPIIEKYSDYADHPYEGDCYLQRTHMFTYQPADLQMYEAWGYQKSDFILKEVQQAYREAMDEIVTIDEEESNNERI